MTRWVTGGGGLAALPADRSRWYKHPCCGMSRFTLTPSPSPTNAGEGSAEASVEASPSNQRLYFIKCSDYFPLCVGRSKHRHSFGTRAS